MLLAPDGSGVGRFGLALFLRLGGFFLLGGALAFAECGGEHCGGFCGVDRVDVFFRFVDLDCSLRGLRCGGGFRFGNLFGRFHGFLVHARFHFDLLGFVGVAILAVEDPQRLTVAPGLVAVFFAVLAFAAGSVINRRLDAALPDASLEAWAMVIGAALLHAGSLAVGESPADVTVTPRSVGALLFLSLAASAFGFLIYFDLLARLGPVEINLVSYAAPVVTAVVGFLFLGEIIDARTVVGFAVILAGFLLVKRRAVAAAFE